MGMGKETADPEKLRQDAINDEGLSDDNFACALRWEAAHRRCYWNNFRPPIQETHHSTCVIGKMLQP